MPSWMPADRAETLSDKPEMPESYLERAREKIIETVLLFGVYPQPRQPSPFKQHRLVRFMLSEFLFDTAGKMYIDPSELEDFFVSALIDHSTIGAFADCRNRWEKKVEGWLSDFFDDSNDLVLEVASELWDDERA